MHLHASALDFLVFMAYFLLAGFLVRVVATRWPDSGLSKALAFVH